MLEKPRLLADLRDLRVLDHRDVLVRRGDREQAAQQVHALRAVRHVLELASDEVVLGAAERRGLGLRHLHDEQRLCLGQGQYSRTSFIICSVSSPEISRSARATRASTNANAARNARLARAAARRARPRCAAPSPCRGPRRRRHRGARAVAAELSCGRMEADPGLGQQGRLAAPSLGRIRYRPAARAAHPGGESGGESRQLPCRRRQVAGGELPAVDAQAAYLGRRLQLGRAPEGLQEPRREALARPHGREGLGLPDLAEGVRRRRAFERRGARRQRGDAQDPRAPAADQLRHHRCSGPVLLEYGNESRSASTCPRSRAARSAGARATASRAPAPTSPACRRAPSDKGDHYLVNGQKIWTSYAQTTPTGSSAWCAPIRTAPKHDGISLPPVRHGDARRLGAADQADQRHVAVLRDLLQRRARAEDEPGRRR